MYYWIDILFKTLCVKGGRHQSNVTEYYLTELVMDISNSFPHKIVRQYRKETRKCHTNKEEQLRK